jgi:DNA-binding transcriptional LysR family regulator
MHSTKLFEEFTIGEIALLADLPHFNSLRTFARSRNSQLSQFSRLMKKLERAFAAPLIERSPSGIRLTQFGKVVCARATDVMAEFQSLAEAGKNRPNRKKEKILTLGSQGFLNLAFAPAFVRAAEAQNSSFGVRFLDLSHDETLVAASAGSLDIILNIEEMALGKAWSSTQVGELDWRLYCRSNHPLLTQKSLAQRDLDNYAIITESYWDGTKVNTNESVFPRSMPLKVGAYESETAATALGIAASSDYLAYVPDIVALALRPNQVSALVISDVQPTRYPLHISFAIDRVSKRFSERAQQEIRTTLSWINKAK